MFVSGQLGVDPGGSMVEGGISEQTEQVMKNLSAILEAAGTSLENIVKATIFLVDLGDFQAMNEVYGTLRGRRTAGAGDVPGRSAAFRRAHRDRSHRRCRLEPTGDTRGVSM